jgi:hypothetical protein
MRDLTIDAFIMRTAIRGVIYFLGYHAMRRVFRSWHSYCMDRPISERSFDGLI